LIIEAVEPSVKPQLATMAHVPKATIAPINAVCRQFRTRLRTAKRTSKFIFPHTLATLRAFAVVVLIPAPILCVVVC